MKTTQSTVMACGRWGLAAWGLAALAACDGQKGQPSPVDVPTPAPSDIDGGRLSADPCPNTALSANLPGVPATFDWNASLAPSKYEWYDATLLALGRVSYVYDTDARKTVATEEIYKSDKSQWTAIARQEDTIVNAKTSSSKRFRLSNGEAFLEHESKKSVDSSGNTSEVETYYNAEGTPTQEERTSFDPQKKPLRKTSRNLESGQLLEDTQWDWSGDFDNLSLRPPRSWTQAKDGMTTQLILSQDAVGANRTLNLRRLKDGKEDPKPALMVVFADRTTLNIKSFELNSQLVGSKSCQFSTQDGKWQANCQFKTPDTKTGNTIESEIAITCAAINLGVGQRTCTTQEMKRQNGDLLSLVTTEAWQVVPLAAGLPTELLASSGIDFCGSPLQSQSPWAQLGADLDPISQNLHASLIQPFLFGTQKNEKACLLKSTQTIKRAGSATVKTPNAKDTPQTVCDIRKCENISTQTWEFNWGLQNWWLPAVMTWASNSSQGQKNGEVRTQLTSDGGNFRCQADRIRNRFVVASYTKLPFSSVPVYSTNLNRWQFAAPGH